MFKGTVFSLEIQKLLYAGELEKAREKLFIDDSKFPSGEMHRVRVLRRLFNSVRSVVAAPKRDGYHKVNLVDFDSSATKIDLRESAKPLSLPTGRYQIDSVEEQLSTFSTDFSWADKSLRNKLSTSRFNTPIRMDPIDTFRIADDVRICCSDKMLFAYISKEKYYDRMQSARIAKACSINFIKEEKRVIPNALLLPIPHHTRNYYHVMAEMVYGMRFIKNIPTTVPIVYSEDHFGIVSRVSKMLGVPASRLLSFSEIEDVRIEKALIPWSPNYFWDKNVFSFFRGLLGKDSEKSLDIYISRRNSPRKLENEEAIEDFLSQRGFVVIFAENLSFETQLFLFANARTVISPHGAGLTNIAFCNDYASLIEIFDESMVVRDYYLRSRHIGIKYRCMIARGVVDLDELDRLLSSLTIDV